MNVSQMALAININELINGQVIEWERLEFKQGWNPEDVLHTLCAFANDINNWGGGYILIGIAEKNGRPVLPPNGLNPDQIDCIQGQIIEICHRLQPNYLPIVQPYVFQRRHILVMYAPAGDMRPYSAPEGLSNEGLKNRFSYIRSGSRNIKAQGETLRRLQELAARIPFDDRINQVASLNELNLGLIREFLQEVKSDLAEESATMPLADLVRQVNIARGPDEALRPINAGSLFFCPEPYRYFERAWIEVQIWQDKIEILSFPGPVPPVNAKILAENKRIVARDYRNRRVGDFLKELHLTEGRGTGIPTIRRAMERNGSPEPIFETDNQIQRTQRIEIKNTSAQLKEKRFRR